MNMDEKREMLQKHLQSGYRKINNLNAKIRKVKAAKGLVMLKRDKILRQVKEEVSHVLRTIEDMKMKFEEDLEGLVEEKASELDSEVDELQEDICMLMEICVESEKILKLGNEQLLEKHSRALVSSFEMLFETDDSFVDYDQMIFMDFKAYNISDTLIRKGLGYIITRENEDEATSNFMNSVGTQVDDLSLRKDMATQTVWVNRGMFCPPPSLGDAAMYNPQSFLVASPNYRPYLMSAAPNFPLNVNQNNFPIPPFLRSTVPYGYFPQLPTSLMETNKPNFSPKAVTKQTTQQSGSQGLETKATIQPSEAVSQTSEPRKSSQSPSSTPVSDKNLINSRNTSLSMAQGENMDTVNSRIGEKHLVDEQGAEASYVPKLNKLPRLPKAKTIERLINSTNSNLVTSKLKTQTSMDINNEEKKMGKAKSFSFRFSPTSSSTPSVNDNPKTTSGGFLHLPQNMQELKSLQMSSVANNKDLKEDIKIDKNHSSSPCMRMKKEVKTKTEYSDFSSKEIKDEKLTEKSLDKESWDEELDSLPETNQTPKATSRQETIVKKEAITESKVASLYPSWHDKVGDERNSQITSPNDSGISPDITVAVKLAKAVGNAQEIQKPMEDKNTGRLKTIFKSENGISKTIDLTQFKSLFEKHIESNNNVPMSGHMVGTGASYHIDQNDNIKAETKKPMKTKAEKNTNLCICTLIHKQSNRKEITASLDYKAGVFGQGALLTDTLSFPIGVAVNSKNEVIVNDTSNHLVKIFNKNVLVNVIGFGDSQMQRPSAIVVNKNDDIFVKDNFAIYVFDKSGNCKYRFGKDKLKQPYGLVMTEDETLLVLDTHRPVPCLYEFHQDGTMISCHPYQPLENSHSMSKCRFMAYHAGNLLVSDLGRSMMYLTNRKGELIHQFARFGNGNGEFNEPSGVTVDCDGHWIVADSKNHRVQVLKPNGEFVSVINFKEPIIRPSDIHWTDDGQLIIVDFLAHSFKVFRLDKT